MLKANTCVLGIDARCLRVQQTGVERMFRNFVVRVPDVLPDARVVLFADGPLPDPELSRYPFEIKIIPPTWGRLSRFIDTWMIGQLPRELARNGINVFYSSNTKFPLGRTQAFVTVHGLEWRMSAADYKIVERLKQWAWFALCTRFSAGIVTFAETTKRDILRMRPDLRIPLCVTGEAAAAIFRRLPDAERNAAVFADRGITAPVILSVCSLEPRKNLETLIRAYAELTRDRAVVHDLVLVGRAAWRSSWLSTLAAELGIASRVHFTGYVTDLELLQFYNHADVFVYPSRYEGFGLPVLEAMACGLPVICSRAGALEDVAGDAALVFDPNSVAELTGTLQRLLREPALRSDLVERGVARAASFSWEKTASDITAFMTHARGAA